MLTHLEIWASGLAIGDLPNRPLQEQKLKNHGNRDKLTPFTPKTMELTTSLSQLLALTCIYSDHHQLCVMTLKGDVIFKEKLTDGLKNDIRNLLNFHGNGQKSENLHFDVLLLSTAYKVSAKKVRKSYLSWH